MSSSAYSQVAPTHMCRRDRVQKFGRLLLLASALGACSGESDRERRCRERWQGRRCGHRAIGHRWPKRNQRRCGERRKCGGYHHRWSGHGWGQRRNGRRRE